MNARIRRYRMVPSEQAGYGPALWVVQEWYYDIRAWFDIGDPLPREAANRRLTQRRADARAVSSS